MFSIYSVSKLVIRVPLYLCLAHDVTVGLVPEWRDIFVGNMKLVNYVVHALLNTYLKEY